MLLSKPQGNGFKAYFFWFRISNWFETFLDFQLKRYCDRFSVLINSRELIIFDRKKNVVLWTLVHRPAHSLEMQTFIWHLTYIWFCCRCCCDLFFFFFFLYFVDLDCFSFSFSRFALYFFKTKMRHEKNNVEPDHKESDQILRFNKIENRNEKKNGEINT